VSVCLWLSMPFVALLSRRSFGCSHTYLYVLSPSLSLSLSLSRSLSLSPSLSHTHTHTTHNHSLSHTHTIHKYVQTATVFRVPLRRCEALNRWGWRQALTMNPLATSPRKISKGACVCVPCVYCVCVCVVCMRVMCVCVCVSLCVH